MPDREGEQEAGIGCIAGRRTRGHAFGVDPSRPHFYSLRQARYEAAAGDIDEWAGAAAANGRRLSVLDVGCGWGVLLRYLEVRPNFPSIDLSATERAHSPTYKPEMYDKIYLGDLAAGYPQIPSGAPLIRPPPVDWPDR